MVEENLLHRDASDTQTLEDLLTADASLRDLAQKLTSEPESGTAAPEGIAESIVQCRDLLSPAIGKLRSTVYSPPQHAQPIVSKTRT